MTEDDTLEPFQEPKKTASAKPSSSSNISLKNLNKFSILGQNHPAVEVSNTDLSSSEESDEIDEPKDLNSEQLDALDDAGGQSKIWQECLEKILEVATSMSHHRKKKCPPQDVRVQAQGALVEGVKSSIKTKDNHLEY